MKKIFVAILCLCCLFQLNCFYVKESAIGLATSVNYYTVYENDENGKVLFLKGDDVSAGDMYLSHDNKLYKIESVDDDKKIAFAKFVKDEKLPTYNVKRKSSEDKASASITKKVGLYHTHNDESYYTPDGVDSVYGEGGIHDVGEALSSNLNKLGITTVYRKDLHLPHNSGAYTRSQVTASEILNEGVDGIFDIHRDSTKRSEYLISVDGVQMSAIRMVVGSSSANYEENKNFAYAIKSYSDSVYPGLVKDVYFGKGNYNQQLSNRAMLFEMGCENIEKDLVIKSTEYLAKIIDVVLYGSENASELSMSDVSLESVGGENVITGLVSAGSNSAVNSNQTLWVVLGTIGIVAVILALVLIFSKTARYKVGRFFSEMFAGIFGKKKAE
jgi:stage II sporulation protein P